MRTSETINELATALAEAQAEMPNAKFDMKNSFFKSGYATLAAIRDAVTPILAKHGLSIVQMTGDADGRMMVYTRMLHKSGQWLESVFPLITDVKVDGNKLQAYGAAMTYARRYSLAAMCNISAEKEDDDGNSTGDMGYDGRQANNGFPPGNKDVKYTKYPADAKPTPGVVRARDNNDFYKKMEKEILDQRTKDTLRGWKEMRDRDLAEKVGEDAMWRLTEFYENHMESLP